MLSAGLRFDKRLPSLGQLLSLNKQFCELHTNTIPINGIQSYQDESEDPSTPGPFEVLRVGPHHVLERVDFADPDYSTVSSISIQKKENDESAYVRLILQHLQLALKAAAIILTRSLQIVVHLLDIAHQVCEMRSFHSQ